MCTLRSALGTPIWRRMRFSTNSIFSSKFSTHTAQLTEFKDRNQDNNVPPTREKHKVQDHLRNLKEYKSVGPNDVHPSILRKLTDEDAKTMSYPSYLKSCGSLVKFPLPTVAVWWSSHWKRGNINPTIKKEEKKIDPGSMRLFNLMSVLSKTMEQILLEIVLRHMEIEDMIDDSQYSFTKGKLCLTNLVASMRGL